MSSYTADRQGNVYKNDSGQDRLLEKMYGCAPGRAVLKPLVNPVLSELGGRILDSRLSDTIQKQCKNNRNREPPQQSVNTQF